MKIEWWKWARRGALAAIAAFCVIGLTGCDEDSEDSDDSEVEVVGTWYITTDGSSSQSIVFNYDGSISMPGDDEFVSGTYLFTEDDDEYSITIFWTRQEEDDDGDVEATYTMTCIGAVTDGYMYGSWSELEDDGSTSSGSWEATEA
ncbi:hypothetical protein PDESU_05455 [Pontiella desulfatans]|uniref:Lipocalin-like domain-containing protein n=1 Tax=Pontiella desulfatans TaxID=2750659 RepID=A0A6C2UAH9_PONDE|nr:hypothetical protein [Pontiella desulfatans]VGO16863.1 hypothetical protein PDESU_05455 [Pontiella desulfatans]